MTDLHAGGTRDRMDVGHTTAELERVDVDRPIPSAPAVRRKGELNIPVGALGSNVFVQGVPGYSLDVMLVFSQGIYAFA